MGNKKEMSLGEMGRQALASKKGILFEKHGDTWYADVDGHTMEENEMIGGADTFLDIMSKGKKAVYMDVSDCVYPKAKLILKRIDHDEYGATYQVLRYHHLPGGLLHEARIPELANRELWLCNVVHTFFGEHPEYISIL